MVTGFLPHGEFKAYLDGRIIVSDVVGPWNRELVDQWAAEMLVLVTQMHRSGPHVGLAILRGSMLCTPDALTAMRQALGYGTAKGGCIGNAVVADADVEGRALMLPTYDGLYDERAPHRFFYDVHSARAWALSLLAAQGF
jgi:hypothetical protein